MTEEAVTAHTLTPVLRVLRCCLHLMVAALLALAAGARRGRRTPRTPPAVRRRRRGAVRRLRRRPPAARVCAAPRGAAALWLAAVALLWLVLLALTPDGVWLAFPLFFLQLHLLPAALGLPAVAATTAGRRRRIRRGTAHPQRSRMVIGPALGAAVAVAVVLGYQALYRESEQRRRLIEELTATRAELAAAEHTAGVLAERERLAREIHDTLAQGLSSIQLLLRAAERALPRRARQPPLGHVEQARTAAVGQPRRGPPLRAAR